MSHIEYNNINQMTSIKLMAQIPMVHAYGQDGGPSWPTKISYPSFLDFIYHMAHPSVGLSLILPYGGCLQLLTLQIGLNPIVDHW